MVHVLVVQALLKRGCNFISKIGSGAFLLHIPFLSFFDIFILCAGQRACTFMNGTTQVATYPKFKCRLRFNTASLQHHRPIKRCHFFEIPKWQSHIIQTLLQLLSSFQFHIYPFHLNISTLKSLTLLYEKKKNNKKTS